MKKIMMLLTIMASVFSATVFNLEFGQPIEQAKKIMIDRGATLSATKEDYFVYTDCKLGAYTAEYIFLLHNEGVLIKVLVKLEGGTELQTLTAYEELVNIYTTKLGNSKEVYEYYSDPYEKGDGYLRQGLELDKIHLFTFWKDHGLTIEVESCSYPNIRVAISSENIELMKKYVAKKRAKESADY